MCGIVGYVGSRAAEELLLAGLAKLEYRGYDSAGISVMADGAIEAVRAVGNLAQLQTAVEARQAAGGATATLVESATIGIGHTRWATHGRVNEQNAHPHFDTSDHVHVVVNGIVENYMELRDRLMAGGASFTSETDAEVIAHLVATNFDGDLEQAVRDAYAELEGHFAFVAMAVGSPELLVGARKECPLIIGVGEGEMFLASAVPAFLAQTRRVQYVENGEIVAVRPTGASFSSADGAPIARDVVTVDWDEETAEKGGFETFMLKEIYEQADAIAETIADRTVREDGVDLDDVGALADEQLRSAKRIIVVACGTSYHAGLIGRYAIEELARVPVDVEIASEYRYRNPIVGPGDLVIGITQSGETADTLAAMRLAKERGATVMAITNIMGSQATRDADGVLYTRAGLEVSVAATKTFVCQVAVMYLLALRLAELHDSLALERRTELVAELKQIPSLISELLEAVDPVVNAVADEGALKLKEVSYISTDAYAAGEMKHGPIALLSEQTPVVTVATDSPVLDKVISNMQEVRARGAYLIAVASAGNETIDQQADSVISIPHTDWILQPLLAVIPLQLLAYRIARLRGLNVDQPRNLAKTVTVE